MCLEVFSSTKFCVTSGYCVNNSTMAKSEINTQIKLSTDNYLSWKLGISCALRAHGLWEIVDGSSTCPIVPEEANQEQHQQLKNWKKNDNKAKTLIINSLDEIHVRLIVNCTTSYDMFAKIVDYREQTTVTSKYEAKKKFTDLTYTAAHNVTSYLVELETITKQLYDLGAPVSEDDIQLKIIHDLPKAFDSFKQNLDLALTAGVPISLRSLKQKLLQVEKQLGLGQTNKQGEALTMQGSEQVKDNSEKHCWNCGLKGHVKQECRRGRMQTNNNFQNRNNYSNNNRNTNRFTNNNQRHSFNNRNNYNSGSFNNNNHRRNTNNQVHNNNYRPNNYHNHRSGNFNNRANNRNNNFRPNQNNSNQQNFANPVQNTSQANNIQEIESNLGLIMHAANASSSSWILDSGCSFHCTSNINEFSEFNKLDKPIDLTIGDGNKVQGIASGTIKVISYDGKQWKERSIQDVLFVPNLGNFNLLSYGSCFKKGFALRVIPNTNQHELYHRDSNTSICIADLIGSTLHLRMKSKTTSNNILMSVSDNNLTEWHERLAHINIHKIISMSKEGLLPPIKVDVDVNKFTCDACIKGKMTRKSFKTVAPREIRLGEAMHCDLQGPMEVPSISGSQYALVVKDEFSTFRSIYFQKFKSDTFASLQCHINFCNRISGNKIKIMRSDNGMEFLDGRVESLLQKNNIHHEYSTPYTPEQNGYVERENRSITELARSLIYSCNLPKFLWAEAMNTAVYSLNLVPNKKLKGITPYEVWTSKKPKYSHLRKFGTICYVRIPDETRKKWDPKARKCIFVGYTHSTSNFRVFDPIANKVIVTCNIRFGDKPDNAVEAIEAIKNDKVTDLKELCATPKLSAKELEEAYNADTDIEDEDTEEPHVKKVCFQAIITNNDPVTYEQAMSSPDHVKWLEAMNDELLSLKKNSTYDLVKLPYGKRCISCRWVFRIKKNVDGSIDKFKARLVAKGYSQKSGVDYFETFSPVARYDSIRAILAISSAKQMHLLQFDVKTAFLYGELEEEIYMNQPPGFEDGTDKVCKLKRGLYGLKQAPRQWNIKVVDFFKKHGFQQSQADQCIFTKFTNGLTIVVIYVDDGLVSSTNKQELLNLVRDLSETFEMKFHKPQIFVGMEITQSNDRSIIKIKQTGYIKELLKRFKMEDCKPVATPGDPGTKLLASKDGPDDTIPYQEAVGALLYLSIISRPDITYNVNKASQFNACYNASHWQAIKRILRYLSGTRDIGITFGADNSNFDLIGYCDADYAADIDTRKSTSGFLCCLGNSPVSWASRLQRSVAQSTTEAEYMAIADCAKDVLWFQQLFKDLQITINKPIVIFSDNQGAILLTRNSVFHKRTKHIDVRYHFIRDLQEEGTIKIQFLPTEKQPADMLTKSLNHPSFSRCLSYINM